MVARMPPRGEKTNLNEVVKFDEMEDESRCGKCREKMTYGQCGMECEMCRE